MISKTVRWFCKNYSQIENYQEAVSSPERWQCHHRNEIDMNLSVAELKEKGLYYNRPPEELIFLNLTDHKRLHGLHMRKETRRKISESKIGKSRSEETKRKVSVTRIEKQIAAGKNNPRYRCICPLLLYKEYVLNNKSAEEVGRIFNIGKRTVFRKLKEFGINIRPKGYKHENKEE